MSMSEAVAKFKTVNIDEVGEPTLGNGKCRIQLLELEPGSKDTPLAYRFLDLALNDTVGCFHAFACMPVYSESTTSSVQDISESETIPAYIENVLFHLRSSDRIQLLWNFEICVDQSSDEDIRRHTEVLKEIYESATEVTVWTHEEEEENGDVFDAYIGECNEQSIQKGMQFARHFAEAPISQLTPLLAAQTDGIHDWVHLLRILCRPFWRTLPLLRTNYVHRLSKVQVQCSAARIEFSILFTAWKRLLIANPIPCFLRRLEMTEENKFEVVMRDQGFVLTSIRAGFDAAALSSKFFWLFRHDEDQRLPVHLGLCQDLYDMKCELFVLAFQRYHGALEPLEDGDPLPVDEEAFGSETPPPPVQFDGYDPHPPLAEHQAPFIPTRMNRSRKLRILELLPEPNISTPVQCAIKDFLYDEVPSFEVVVNETCLRRSLAPVEFHGVKFSLSTKSHCPILVNGQAFIVPKLQELFLRLVRDRENSKYLFLYTVCSYLEEMVLETREHIEHFAKIKRAMKSRGKEIDMFEVLVKAEVEREMVELRSLGLPLGKDWDEWLLELNE